MAEEINTKELATQLLWKFKDMKKEVGDVWDEIKEKDWTGAFKEIPDVLSQIQELGKAMKLTGEQKKEVAVHLINEMVNIPILPESIERKIISAVVESVLVALKSKFNK